MMKKAIIWIIFMCSVIGVLVLYCTGILPVLVGGEANTFNRVLRYILYFVFGMSALFSSAYIIADEPKRKKHKKRHRRRK